MAFRARLPTHWLIRCAAGLRVDVGAPHLAGDDLFAVAGGDATTSETSIDCGLTARTAARRLRRCCRATIP